MKSYTTLGLICGLALAFGAIFGGFAGFICVLLLGALGLGIGLQLDGRVDFTQLASALGSSRGGKG